MSTASNQSTLASQTPQLPFVLARHENRDCYFDIKLTQIEPTTFHGRPAHQLSLKLDLARPFDTAKRIQSATVAVKVGRRSKSQGLPQIVGINPEASLVHIADHEITNGQNFGVTAGSPPTAPGSVSVNYNMSKADTTKYAGNRLIHGFLVSDNEAQWKLYEEPKSKSGLPPSMHLLMIVESTASFRVSARLAVSRWSGWAGMGLLRNISAPLPNEPHRHFTVRSNPDDLVGERALKASDDIATFLRESEEKMHIRETIVGNLFPMLQEPNKVQLQYLAVLRLHVENERVHSKQINVPFLPSRLTLGREVAKKSRADETNGIFKSRIFSLQHAEVWADKAGKVWIKDTKSRNGTFVNGARLSLEYQESQPRELRERNRLQFGTDVANEDGEVVYHKVSTKVEYVGFPDSSDDRLRMDSIQLATRKDEEKLAEAIKEENDLAKMIAAKFKVWTEGASGEDQLEVLGVLRGIAENRLRDRLAALCVESRDMLPVSRMDRPIDPIAVDYAGGPRIREREQYRRRGSYGEDMYDMETMHRQGRPRPVRDSGGVDRLLFGRSAPNGEQALQTHRTVGGGWTEAKL